MARYSTNVLPYSTYSQTSKYGADGYVAVLLDYIYAVPTDKDGYYFDTTTGNPVFDQITVFWKFQGSSPGSPLSPKMKVLRSVRGFPIGDNDPSSVDIGSPGVDTKTGIHYITDIFVTPGRDYYYGVFIEDPSVFAINNTVTRWLLVGTARTHSPRDHTSIERMYSTLPPYMTSTAISDDGKLSTYEILGVRDPSIVPGSKPVIPKYLAGISWVWDAIITEIDRLGRLWNPLLAPSETLEALAKTLGLPVEPSLGDSRLRSLIQSVHTINGQRGASTGIQALSEGLSGYNSQVVVGKNLMLNIEQASFTYGTGLWSTGLAFRSTNPVSGANISNESGIEIALTNDLPGCAEWSRNASASSVVMVNGMSNSNMVHSNGLVRVTTSRAHGLSVGDVIDISGSTKAVSGTIDGTYRVSVVFDLTSYGFEKSSSSTLVSYGRTIPPASGPNPLVVSHGVPLPYIPEYSRSISNKVLTDNVATLTTTTAHGLRVGDKISVSGVDSTFNGSYTVTAIPTTTTFSYAKTATNVSSTAISTPYGTVLRDNSYTFSFNAYATSLTGNHALTLDVLWYDVFGNLLSTSSSVVTNTLTTSLTTWNRANGTATAPEKAAFVDLRVNSPSGGPSSFKVFLDKFQVSLTNISNPAVYEEPRTVFVTLSFSGTNFLFDRVIRTVILSRVKARVKENVVVGTPIAVRMQPAISTDSPLPSKVNGSSVTGITFSAVYEGSGVTWSATNLPSGLSLNSSTGALTGTAPAAGTYYFTVTAVDDNGIKGSKNFSIVIT